MTTELFRRRANRLCLIDDEYGIVPLGTDKDDTPNLIGPTPVNDGDRTVVFVEGQYRNVVLRKYRSTTYLFDQGPAWS